MSTAFTRHDRYEFEMVFRGLLDSGARRGGEYHIDTYFFLPASLGMNQETYGQELFYRDLRRYLRLKTPVVHLSDIPAPGGPLDRLQSAILKLEQAPSAASERAFSEEIKLFCSIFKSALRDETQLLFQESGRPDFPQDFRRMQESVDRLICRFRDLGAWFPANAPGKTVMVWFRLADEFISVLVDKYRARQCEMLSRHPAGVPLTEMLCGAMRREIEYRRSRQYLSVPDPATEHETMIYRESMLKKLMASVLFLQIDRRRDGVLAENLLFGLAAAIAMALVTAISFIWHSLFLEQFSMAFFTIWVLAYVGKDRLKDFLKMFFKNRLRRYFYDYRTRLSYALGRNIGSCRESAAFEPESRLPESVRKLRGRSMADTLVNAEYAETILHARESVSICPDGTGVGVGGMKINGIVDIMRFNIRHFLEHMDNPEQEIILPEGSRLCRTAARRVYHVNVIVQINAAGSPETVRRFRLVLARDGIRRIESVTRLLQFCTPAFSGNL